MAIGARARALQLAAVFSLTLAAGAVLIAQQPAPPAQSAPDPDLVKRLKTLEDGQRELMRQLQEIKSILEAATGRAPAGPPPNLTLSIDNAATSGRADAPLTMVEFSDFQFPYCGKFTREVLPQLLREYVDTGKIRLVFRHFPIPSLHPDALKAAEAGECARLQGKFWPMHDKLFANQEALAAATLPRYASAIGLDATAFQSCLNGSATKTVQQDIDTGTRATVTGTPTFFVGTMQDGQVHVLRMLVGAAPFESFKGALDDMLSKLPTK